MPEASGDRMMDDSPSLGVSTTSSPLESSPVRSIEAWLRREGGCIDVLFEV